MLFGSRGEGGTHAGLMAQGAVPRPLAIQCRHQPHSSRNECEKSQSVKKLQGNRD